MNDPWDKQGYQKPVVRRMSVEEMLTEAQTAVDGLFDRYHKAEANLGDQEEVLSAIRTELDGIEQALSKAERAVQRLAYVTNTRRKQMAEQQPQRPTQAEIDSWFVYHKPDETQIAQYLVLREKAKELAKAIMLNCPQSADRTVAIRKVREAVMTANASIACEGGT